VGREPRAVQPIAVVRPLEETALNDSGHDGSGNEDQGIEDGMDVQLLVGGETRGWGPVGGLRLTDFRDVLVVVGRGVAFGHHVGVQLGIRFAIAIRFDVDLRPLLASAARFAQEVRGNGDLQREHAAGALLRDFSPVIQIHTRESEHARWKADVLSGRLALHDENADTYKLYAHQNEDIVRLTPEELKRKMAEKEARAASGPSRPA